MVSTSRYKYIACDAEKCIGCQLCEDVCSYTKTGEYNTYRSRIRTVRVDEILSDHEGGPVLKVKDIVDYVTWRSKTS